MIKNPFKGKLVVFEGIDGCGKATQTKFLIRKLKQEGYKTKKIDFPQYGKKSAGLVEEYLNGKYGSAESVGPYIASMFYACDRYDGSFKIRKWLKQGNFVVCDRYIGSNIGHQGGKIKDNKKRKEYIKWLYHLEYKFFNIPKPTISFILKTTPQLARKLAGNTDDEEKKKKRKSYLGDKKQDLHEESFNHLKNALDAYSFAAKESPQDFEVIECIKDGKLLSKKEIHKKIWKKTKMIL